MPSGSSAFESLATRLGHDLRTRFPAIEVRVGPKDDDVVCEVVDGGEPWGSISLVDDHDDDFSLAEIEQFVASVVTSVTDNLWPDELTDPWPLCPTHRDHPLQPGMVSGRASWRCLQDDATVVPVGELIPVSSSPRVL